MDRLIRIGELAVVKLGYQTRKVTTASVQRLQKKWGAK
jgi:hypothetical protein